MSLENLQEVDISGDKQVEDLRFLLRMDAKRIYYASGFLKKRILQRNLIQSLERKY